MQDLVVAVVAVVDGHYHSGWQRLGWMTLVLRLWLRQDGRRQAWAVPSFAEAINSVYKRNILLAVTNLGIFFGQMFIHFQTFISSTLNQQVWLKKKIKVNPLRTQNSNQQLILVDFFSCKPCSRDAWGTLGCRSVSAIDSQCSRHTI